MVQASTMNGRFQASECSLSCAKIRILLHIFILLNLKKLSFAKKHYLCTMIFYFSCTGNSFWVAKVLSERLDDRLVNMADEIQGDGHYVLGSDERIGFVFPVHGWRTPCLVRRFIDKLSIKMEEGNPHYAYLILTAGDSIGRTVERLLPHLQAKGIEPQLFASLIMPESYVGLPFMDVDSPSKETKKKAEAAQALDRLAEIIGRRDCNHCDSSFQSLTRGPLPGFFSGVVGSFFEHFLISDKPFHVVAERCLKCGRCAGVCPVGDIGGGKGSVPRWLHHGDCLTCFSCYHHCPTHAIEFGRRTRHKGQYFFTRNQ